MTVDDNDMSMTTNLKGEPNKSGFPCRISVFRLLLVIWNLPGELRKTKLMNVE